MRPLGIVSAAALVVLGGCTGSGEEPTPGLSPRATAPTATGTTPPPTSEPTDDPTTTATALVDCEAVEEARTALTDGTNAELERLEVARSDPRAFSVQVLVTSQLAAEYWTAVRDAVDPAETELRADADTVVDYWVPLDADLDAIEIADGSEAALAEATDAYLEVSSAHPDDEVLPAQERLTAGVDAACGGAPSS